MIEGDGLFVDRDDVIRWKLQHPQPYSPDVYQGLYTDPHGTIEEPYVMRIHDSQLGKITKEQRAAEWDVWQTSLHNPEFAGYAQLCGAFGVRVAERAELDDALASAFAYEGPALVEVVTDPDLI